MASTFLFRMAMAAGFATGAAACTEPVDCAAAPGRCVTTPPPSLSASQGTLAPAQVNEAPQIPQVAQAPSRWPMALPSVRERGRKVIQAPVEAPVPEPPAAAPTADDASLEAAILALLPAIKAHDVAALKAQMTDRLRTSLENGVLDKQAPRFWRHLDRYAVAMQAGLVLTSEPGDTPDARQLHIRATDGNELKPILVRDGKGWKVERF